MREPTGGDRAATVRVRLLVAGHVQGVGFRFFVQRRAAPLGLGGFVRNLRDGRVEVVAEGMRDRVEALIEAVREGPSGAQVRDVDVRWEPPMGETGFGIGSGGGG